MRSINQVRHFYVMPEGATVVKSDEALKAAKEGSIYVVNKNGTLVFKYKSPGGLESSDVIKVDNVLYAVNTPATAMAVNLKGTKVTLASNPIAGQEYIVKVLFRNYAGAGDDTITVKYGMAVASKTETKESLATKLKDSLVKNLKDLVPLASVTSDASSVTITEVEQPWEAGVKPFAIMPFEVSVMAITEEGVETTEWATLSDVEGAIVYNDKKIADMEWFHTGARGDMYRGFGYPYGVKTKLLATSTETGYDTLDIHYAYVGPNEGVQKSEKTITIAAPAGESALIDAVIAELTGIEVEVAH